jgi:hypothetical protein
MSFSPIAIARVSFCGCALAGADTPANSAAAATSEIEQIFGGRGNST